MRFLKSFLYAFNGLKRGVCFEKNFRIQLFFGVMVIITGALLHISKLEWIAVILCISMVLSFEIFNSAVEAICNFISPAIHPSIKIIKDLSAAAVLVAALASAIVGSIIFLPKLYPVISRFLH